MIRRALSWRVALAAALALAMPALAQQRAQPPAQTPAPPAQAEPLPTVYEPDMLRLAEIMGSLAFLRQLCGGSEAAEWRARMAELIDAEGVTEGRRDRLAGAFNRGFRAFALTYRSCTPAAIEASERLSADGRRLSRGLAGRFGG